MVPNSNYSTLLATTIENFGNKIFDNVITNTTLARYLNARGNVKVVGGGEKFVHQLLYQKNSSFASRASMDTIALPVEDPLTCSQWDVKVLSGSIVLPELDVAKNAGNREKLLDYAGAIIRQAELSMSELLSDQIWTAAASIGANDMDSISKIVAQDVTASTSIGGINQSGETWWRNVSYDTVVTGFATSNEGINAIDINLNATTFGTQGPKIIVTDKTIFSRYMLSLTSNVRYTQDDLGQGDAGFRKLMYATLPFVADDDCESGNIYGIDLDSLKLQILAQGNMKRSPFKFATNQLATSSLMYLFANLTCGSRRTNFVIDSVTG